MKYKVTVSKGMAGRITATDTIDDYEEPYSMYGFYWWFWKPRFNSNSGKFKRNECVDVSIQWLCFWFGFVFWPQTRRSDDQAHSD